jgi:hypothetical protein
MAKSVEASSSLMEAPIPGLNITSAIALWIAVTTIVPLSFAETLPNALGLAILFFNNLNILIAFCEIALGNHIRFIQRDYLERKKLYEGKEWKAAFQYLTMPLSLSTLFSGEKWAIMWSTYSLWDPSYQNQESFGFFIDVGNGWSTIPPCLLWNVAILFPGPLQTSWQYAWLLVGVLGCASYWQVLYGTVIYFLSFFFNKRHVGRPIAEVVGFVGVANGIWFFFPLFALYATVIILRDQSLLAIFR